jgi:hypothetical protein
MPSLEIVCPKISHYPTKIHIWRTLHTACDLANVAKQFGDVLHVLLHSWNRLKISSMNTTTNLFSSVMDTEFMIYMK